MSLSATECQCLGHELLRDKADFSMRQVLPEIMPNHMVRSLFKAFLTSQGETLSFIKRRSLQANNNVDLFYDL